ncbi:MAG TPA: CU044_5270 family protein [Solirubrobacterales bacterium]|nr:CU044_5270 family protein [Solirubrobacterales bacterium]
MSEIDLLRQLRAGLPGPRAESRASARGALVARIEQSLHEAPETAPRRRRHRLQLLVAMASLGALLIALPTLILGGGGQVQPAVEQLLRATAAVAAVQPAEPPPGPGQYYYTRSREAYLTSNGFNPRCATHACDREHPWEATRTWSVRVPKIRQTWVGADGAGRARVVYARPEFLTPGQRRAWKAAGSPPLSSGGVEDFALEGQPFIDTSDLPTRPKALRRLIEARKIPLVDGPPGEAETFTLIGDMLRATYLPPAYRAALYRAVAELPEVESLGEVKDPVGREGVGVAFTKGAVTHELIFDPETSALLGEREVAARRISELQVPAGTETGSVAYLESKVVDSLGRGAPPGAGHLRQSVGCSDRPSMRGSMAVVHGPDPIAICAKLWSEGVVGTAIRRLEREGKVPENPDKTPDLVACVGDYPATTYVFPGESPSLCRRLGLRPSTP